MPRLESLLTLDVIGEFICVNGVMALQYEGKLSESQLFSFLSKFKSVMSTLSKDLDHARDHYALPTRSVSKFLDGLSLSIERWVQLKAVLDSPNISHILALMGLSKDLHRSLMSTFESFQQVFKDEPIDVNTSFDGNYILFSPDDVTRLKLVVNKLPLCLGPDEVVCVLRDKVSNIDLVRLYVDAEGKVRICGDIFHLLIDVLQSL